MPRHVPARGAHRPDRCSRRRYRGPAALRLQGLSPAMAFAELCDHLELHLPDRGQPSAGICPPGDRARPAGLRHRRPQLGRRPRPGAPGAARGGAGGGCGAAPPAGGAALPRRGARADRPAARPRRLGPALPGADRRGRAGPGRASACSCSRISTELGGDAPAAASAAAARRPEGLAAAGARLRRGGTRTRIWSASPRYDGQDAARLARLARLAEELGPAARRLGRADHAPRRAAGGWWTC